jgi:hypothetical protein
MAARTDWVNGEDVSGPDMNAIGAEINSKPGDLLTMNTQTGSYTLVLGDVSKVIEMNVAGANNLTVPPNSSVAFSVGTVIEVMQYGAGQTTIVAGSGVLIRSPGGKMKIAARYGSASLRKRGTDEWTLEGNLTT